MNSNKTLCIIDDDDIYKYAVKRAVKFKKLDNNIITFSNGEEALFFFKEKLEEQENLPDIIFLDINMPLMDGFEFIEEYVKIKPFINKDVTIYMISSSILDADIKRVKAINEVSDYLLKPIKPDDLATLLTS